MCATASGGDNTDRYFAKIGYVFVRRRRPLRALTELCKKPMRPLMICGEEIDVGFAIGRIVHEVALAFTQAVDVWVVRGFTQRQFK